MAKNVTRIAVYQNSIFLVGQFMPPFYWPFTRPKSRIFAICNLMPRGHPRFLQICFSSLRLWIFLAPRYLIIYFLFCFPILINKAYYEGQKYPQRSIKIFWYLYQIIIIREVFFSHLENTSLSEKSLYNNNIGRLIDISNIIVVFEVWSNRVFIERPQYNRKNKLPP